MGKLRRNAAYPNVAFPPCIPHFLQHVGNIASAICCLCPVWWRRVVGFTNCLAYPTVMTGNVSQPCPQGAPHPSAKEQPHVGRFALQHFILGACRSMPFRHASPESPKTICKLLIMMIHLTKKVLHMHTMPAWHREEKHGENHKHLQAMLLLMSTLLLHVP